MAKRYRRAWESEKHKSWSIPAEDFKDHVATGGSLPGKAGKWRACGWAVVQLDYGEEMGPLHVEAELEVQRTTKRAELTVFLCLLNRVIGALKVYIDNKGIIDGLRRRERERERASSHEREMPIYGSKFGNNCIIWQKGAFW